MHDIIYSYARDKKTQLCHLLLSSMPDLDLGHTNLIFVSQTKESWKQIWVIDK